MLQQVSYLIDNFETGLLVTRNLFRSSKLHRVLIAILTTAFGENLLTAAQYGYSFDLLSDVILPPPVDYPYSVPSNGNAYKVVAGTGDAGTSDGEISDDLQL